MAILRSIFNVIGIFCTSYTVLDCIGEPVSINGESMIPTINPGEVVWISKLAKPKRDNIFVFTSPADPSRNNIKRIAGIIGDFAENKQGERVTIPHHYFWMLSDNFTCPTVNDSRAYGAVHKSLLKGKATFLIWPPSRWSNL